MTRPSIPTLFLALLLGAAAAASAQTPCDDALQQAEKSYQLGLFEDIPAQLAACLKGGVSRRTEIQARSLLARAYLYGDEREKARKEVSAILRLDSTFEATSPATFAALVAEVRREEQTTQVASVSKTSESLREAPATVLVVTGDEIRRRGYLDLEELLHDLPGFDLSRLNGDTYSYVYQRGYRSVNNDRLLLLVDGVEQNELSTNTLYLSRQYPLANIDRVEVVQGPASTMYGANAYTGVISIITKDPEGLIPETKRFAVAGQETVRDTATNALDLTMAGKDQSGTIAWSVAGNFQKSKERDLSRFAPWDYTYQHYDYASLMNLSGAAADAFSAAGNCAAPSAYFQCAGTTPGQRSVELTPQGINLVRGLDAGLVSGNALGFHDRAKNWSLYGKLRISNLTLGLQTWRSEEGLGSAVPAFAIGGNSSWTPSETAFYLKYSIPLDRLKVNVFTRYLQTGQVRSHTEYDYLHNYAWGMLSMWSLVAPCVSPSDQQPVDCAPAKPWVERLVLGSLSSQLRSEINAVYESSDKLSAVTGLEFAKSSIQTTWDQHSSGPGERIVSPDITSEQIEHTDVAVYAQGSYRPRRSVRLVLAGRLSHNEINNRAGAAGFGTLFTPRAGVIYSPGDRRLVYKAIYSEAFKDPTDFQKFGTLTLFNPIPANGLKPERVRNIELSAGWERPSNPLALEAAVFQARYSNVVNYGQAPGCADIYSCLQFQNRDSIRVRGAQLTARYRLRATELWSNYTRTEPEQLDPSGPAGNPLPGADGNPVSRIRVADIADNRFNLGADSDWSGGFHSGLRLHYVGPRRTGEGTTAPESPLHRVDPYTTMDVVFSYKQPALHATLQLIAENVFNKQYYDPTVVPAIGAPPVLQKGRTVYLRLVYGSSLQR